MAIEISSILFPTDFSDVSVGALDHARTLAEKFKARLHCLHVVDDAYQYWTALGPESVPVGPPPQELEQLANERLETFRKEHLTGLPSEPVASVVLGRPFAEIIRYAREQNVELIVMATHGRGAISQMLLGSTTEKVVRKAPCAVLTVRATVHEFVMP